MDARVEGEPRRAHPAGAAVRARREGAIRAQPVAAASVRLPTALSGRRRPRADNRRRGSGPDPDRDAAAGGSVRYAMGRNLTAVAEGGVPGAGEQLDILNGGSPSPTGRWRVPLRSRTARRPGYGCDRG